MRRTATAVTLAALLFGPLRAHPAEDAAKAASRALLRQGNAWLDQGKFEQALDQFRQAYQRFASPKIFFGEGQALAGLGRNVEALAVFQRFLAEAEGASVEHQAEARRQVAVLLEKVGRLEVRSNRQGALVHVDDKGQGATPLGGPLLLEPGEHRLSVEWQGAVKTSVLVVAPGATASADVTFEPKPVLVGVRSNRLGAVVRLDGKEVGRLPLVAALPVSVGEHELVLEHQGEAQSRHFAVAEGETRTLEVNFADRPAILVAATPQPPPAPAATRAWYRSPWAWGAAAVVVAGVTTALILIYGQRDRYPSGNMGSHPIGD
jgi:hypothetical protein